MRFHLLQYWENGFVQETGSFTSAIGKEEMVGVLERVGLVVLERDR